MGQNRSHGWLKFPVYPGIQDTIIPRLMAAGADTRRVHIVAAATKPDGTGRKTFSLKTDVDLLEAKAKEIGCVRLIIVDPISAYMGGSDGNGNVETREVLEPLADMANRLRIAVVAVTHLNKGGSGGNQSALNRFAGSIAFVAAARAAFAVIEDPEDDERRLLLQAKNNLGAKCKGLAFRMEQRLVEDDILSSNISSQYIRDYRFDFFPAFLLIFFEGFVDVLVFLALFEAVARSTAAPLAFFLALVFAISRPVMGTLDSADAFTNFLRFSIRDSLAIISLLCVEDGKFAHPPDRSHRHAPHLAGEDAAGRPCIRAMAFESARAG